MANVCRTLNVNASIEWTQGCRVDVVLVNYNGDPARPYLLEFVTFFGLTIQNLITRKADI